MTTRHAHARWEGGIKDGSGHVETESAALESRYSFRSRFESDQGTNPEELLGAAEAGCLAMAVSKALGEAGHTPDSVDVDAKVSLGESDGGPTITGIALSLRASAADLDDEELERIARKAKETCPVSRALAATEITLEVAHAVG